MSFIDAASGIAETPMTIEQTLLELTFVAVAIGALPDAMTIPLAVPERAAVAAAVGVVDTPFALQQSVDHLASVATAVRQDGIGGYQRLAITAGGKQAAERQWKEAAHAAIQTTRCPAVCRKRGGVRQRRTPSIQTMQSARVSAM